MLLARKLYPDFTRSSVLAHSRNFSARLDGCHDILSAKNKERCQRYLYHGTDFKDMSWMKGRKEIKKAAVLVPLCTISGEPALLYTLRSHKLSSHTGQVSFPGGHHDDTDPHMLHTALREAEEEIGLSEKKVDVWGQMAPVPGKNFDTAVTPILANCGELDIDSLNPNHNEVDSIFTVSIARLCDPKLNGHTYFKKAGYELPVFTGGPHRIWGLTAIITHLCLKIIIHDKKLYTLKIPWSNRISHS